MYYILKLKIQNLASNLSLKKELIQKHNVWNESKYK